MKILLLEDNLLLSETLEIFLSKEGYDVDIALSMEEAEDLTFEKKYDLYLLDINLPEGSGLEFLEAMRFAQDDTPSIFITALNDINSMAKGFALGAVDYIKKPFDPQELLIRISAKFASDIVIYGDLEYDPSSRLLRNKGEIVDLGNVQMNIFELLLSKRGSLVGKEELYECLENGSDMALRVAITKIKQKLNLDIKNIRAKGYMIEKL